MMEETQPEESAPRGSLDFAESSILDAIVPLASDLNIEEALSGSVARLDEQNDSPLAAIPQRHAVYFDETVNIYVVLQTPYFDERSLRSYLGRLSINLEAYVVNAHTEQLEGAAGRELIYQGSIQDTEDPLIVVQGAEEGEESDKGGHILAVWKQSVFLARPRLRLQNPSVIVTATASLRAAEQTQPNALREEYLPSQAPSGLNLLQAFSDDILLKGVKPRLSALRVARVAPAAQVSRELTRPLKNISRRSIKVYPAINSRVRYSRPSGAPSTSSVIASLDIDITPFANCEITITDIQLKVHGGQVQDLNQIPGLVLPVTCRPQDEVSFLYRLLLDDMDIINGSQVRAIDISITAIANVTAECKPKIVMQWSTSLDFTPPINNGFGQPTKPIQRPHRPSQLSIGATFDSIPIASSLAISRPDALPTIEATTPTRPNHQRTTSVPDFGVTMTFSSPTTSPIYPGHSFIWSIFIVNRSDRPRKLALLVLPKRRRTEARINRPPSMGQGSTRRDPKVADAVMDDNIIYAMQRNSAMESSEVVCLSTDTRVGPLAPSACYEVELKFMALREGIVGVEAVRVVDLGTQEHVDIKDLPTIVVKAEPEK
ncbi:TRAPP trafficking subunit trs65 domain-containing protein [Rutstroemia sp. NJR-2017a BVV2]|nr:TRAPP trafficking subunit trs65 domain-containing protein [Rutstroemia sp. NJR-2017a BVV2]